MKKQLLYLLTMLSIGSASAQFTITQAPDVYLCGDSGGFVIYNFEGVAEAVLGSLSPAEYTVSIHTTQADANSDTFSINSTATGQSPTTYFVRVESNVNPNDYQTTSYEMYINMPPAIAYQQYTFCDTDNDGLMTIVLEELTAQIYATSPITPGSVEISYYATTNDAVNQTNPLSSPFFNNSPYQYTLYAVCEFVANGCSTMVPVQIYINFCAAANEPDDIALCTDGPVTCFNLASNTPIVLTGVDAADYTVSYHLSLADAQADTAAITNPANYCNEVQSEVIYVRLEENVTGEYEILDFYVYSQTTIAGTISLPTMVQCDENNDGTVIFDLPTAAAQLNTTNTLSYYSNSADASAGVNPMGIPSSFSISSTMNVSTVVFIREEVVGGCDIIHSLPISSLVNCNVANACAAANSLCNSLGIPFSNTININAAEPFYYGCLTTTPNPTWFYIPISQPGTVSLQIEQNTSIDFNGGGIDIDYICYGPFPNPSAACLNPSLMANSIVSCSYSTAAIEYPQILNAQAGQYYLIMVTNFSNFPGYIKITETTATQGEIDCTGIRLTAFLDSDGNGTQEVGEPNFPLGEFNYELNNDGTVHNIISPTGTYNIYDLNASNSYDVSYSIDPAYASNYSLTTSAYNNISVVPGAGMQDYYFPITVSQPYNDLSIAIIPNDPPRPGFNYTNTIKYTNFGSQTVPTGTITFTNDPLLSITWISQAGTVPTATGFTYGFTNLLPFESREIDVSMLVPNIPVVALGNLLTNTADIVPLSGDLSPENNSATSSQIIIGSYDPNDKMESHGGDILFSNFTSSDYLYYTVRFENTGTASAINVRITDILDSMLDPTSLRMVAASHDYILDRVDNSLTWSFNNIMLPSTAQNPVASKGFVHFKVKPNPGYAVGDIIPNTASIFFDFNPAIVTNTFNTEFVAQLAVEGFAASEFTIYPNPVTDILSITAGINGKIQKATVFDLLGKTIISQTPEENVSFTTMDLSGLSSGLYIVEIVSSSNITSREKLIVR